MRIIVLYHARFAVAPAISHYLMALKRHSAHEVEYFNVLQPVIDLSDYDVVFINFCVVSFARHPAPFMEPLTEALQRYRGRKVASVQDEYDFTDKVKRFLCDVGVDIVLTNVPPVGIPFVYTGPEFANVRFLTVQTAYLSEELLTISPSLILPLTERLLVVGYRGRKLPYRLGDLGWHKAEVGIRFKRICEEAGLQADIEVEEARRLSGDAWLEFIRSCQVMLGSPSGSNVFDFDGSLHQWVVAQYNADPTITYADVRQHINTHQVSYDMAQISARIYEAAVQKTALALVRGGYSGVIEPDEHYVPIEPDYSNIDQVLERLTDTPAMQAMADRAYHHIISDPRNRYAHMIAQLDKLICSE